MKGEKIYWSTRKWELLIDVKILTTNGRKIHLGLNLLRKKRKCTNRSADARNSTQEKANVWRLNYSPFSSASGTSSTMVNNDCKTSPRSIGERHMAPLLWDHGHTTDHRTQQRTSDVYWVSSLCTLYIPYLPARRKTTSSRRAFPPPLYHHHP